MQKKENNSSDLEAKLTFHVMWMRGESNGGRHECGRGRRKSQNHGNRNSMEMESNKIIQINFLDGRKVENHW